jgi:hypothetical protein
MQRKNSVHSSRVYMYNICIIIYHDQIQFYSLHTAWTVNYEFNLVLLTLFLCKKWLTTPWKSYRLSITLFHGVVNHFIHKKRVNNTKFDTNLTVQGVYIILLLRSLFIFSITFPDHYEEAEDARMGPIDGRPHNVLPNR